MNSNVFDEESRCSNVDRAKRTRVKMSKREEDHPRARRRKEGTAKSPGSVPVQSPPSQNQRQRHSTTHRDRKTTRREMATTFKDLVCFVHTFLLGHITDVIFRALSIRPARPATHLDTRNQPPSQRVDPSALQDLDIIGIFETGSGKTVAFALPVLQELLKKPQPLFRSCSCTDERTRSSDCTVF